MSIDTHSKHSRLSASKLHRLLAYLENVGVDATTVARRAEIDLDKISKTNADEKIPSIYYALIYNEAVSELQRRDKHPPWAAGLGSTAFRMMCYCVVSCKTLGDALERACEFYALTYPLTGQRVELKRDAENRTCQIIYDVDHDSMSAAFAPANWTIDECHSVAISSGLETLLGFSGWLIGRRIEASRLDIGGSMLSESYLKRLREVFQCSISFNAPASMVVIPEKSLELRLVHDSDSVTEFLNTGPFLLWSNDDQIVSTTAAIKSLLGTNFKSGIPSFERMAQMLHMSASTLRRHLLSEGSNYQKIKDERRRDIAIELLCMSNQSINDISEEVGFADTSSFVRSFRGWTGQTPKAYRDQTQALRVSSQESS